MDTTIDTSLETLFTKKERSQTWVLKQKSNASNTPDAIFIPHEKPIKTKEWVNIHDVVTTQKTLVS